MNVVFASNNSGKIKELQELLKNKAMTIVPQASLGVEDIPETGLTFIENALLKARHASLKTGMPAIADDSGLVIKALEGKPGIYSARFAGNAATSKDNIQKVLTELAELDNPNRDAFFYCGLVYLHHYNDPTPIISEGRWYGQILKEPVGLSGFGYDPIFYDAHNQCSAAELSPWQKNRISHRGKALQLLLQSLQPKEY